MTAPPVVPRPAATTLIVRDGAAGLEVLMVRRSPNASFMPGAYVFPGGAVDAADGAEPALARLDEPAAALQRRIGTVTHVGDAAAAFAVAALRETFEECGLWLLPQAHAVPHEALLVSIRMLLHNGSPLPALAAQFGLPLASSTLQPWAHWCTPAGLPKRFDTLFFVAAAPPGQEPSVDEGETTTLAWVHPPAALQAHAGGGFPMEFATVSTVRSLAPLSLRGEGDAGSVAAVLRHAAALADLPAIHPRLKRDAEGKVRGVLMPGDEGYEAAA